MEHKRSSLAPDDNCTFTPDINMSQEHGLNKSFQSKVFNKTTRNFIRHAQARNQELETQASYKPTIGRLPENRLKHKRENIGEYLYKQRVRCTPLNVSVNDSKSITIDKSTKLLKNVKERCFRAIFKAINGDEDGVINIEDLEILPKDISELYKPMLYKIRKGINLEEYIKISHSIFKESVNTSTLFSFYQLLKKRMRNFPFNEYSFKVFVLLQ
jgi:hypothetical protein